MRTLAGLMLATLALAGCARLLGLDPIPDAPPAPGVLPDGTPPDAAASGPVAYYKMDGFGPAGTTAPDETGHHDGFFTNGQPTLDDAGRFGDAYAFDGLGELLHISPAADLQRPELTVSIWTRIDAAPVDGACFINQLLPAGKDTWQVCIDVGGYLHFLADGGSGSTTEIVSPSPVADGVWRNVALVLHAGEMIAYYDGGRIGSEPLQPSYDPMQDIVLGGDIDSDVIAPYKGSLDELKIFGRALSDAEVAALASR